MFRNRNTLFYDRIYTRLPLFTYLSILCKDHRKDQIVYRLGIIFSNHSNLNNFTLALSGFSLSSSKSDSKSKNLKQKIPDIRSMKYGIDKRSKRVVSFIRLGSFYIENNIQSIFILQ